MPENKNYFSSRFKLGILGGGQLGKMLLSETRRYDIRTKVMDPSPKAPCRIGSNEFVEGNLNSKEDVLEFARDCDVITIEIENVNTEALRELEEKGKKVYPRPALLEIIKNKARQKDFYREHNIPTAPFFTFKNKEELHSRLMESSLKPPFVWKVASGGYDGRGVEIIEHITDLDPLPDREGIIEQKISFEREIAVVIARSASGEVKSYPVVEMDFHPTANLVEYVFSPSEVDDHLQLKAVELAETLVEKMEHIGLMAIEMFALSSGEILVNEVAPRVHNSGHLSIEGHETSQFDQHLRAILDLPLGGTKITQPAVMINLTGEESHEGPVKYDGIEELMKIPGAAIHLYGKAETRPFRKMGHVTVTGSSLEDARSKARQVKDTIKVISQ